MLVGVQKALAQGCLADIAPSPLIASRLKDMAVEADVAYVGMDFDPAADSRVVNLQASMTQMPLPDRSVGLMVCFHVLEHIPDDAAAISEIARVLAPDGLAVVQVPRRSGVPTDEDPAASKKERVTRFGQADHVRYYGDDFEDRLIAGGLTVTSLSVGDLYDPTFADLLGIPGREPVWLCSSGPGPDVEELVAGCDTAARTSLARGLARLAAERDEATGELRMVRQRLRRARRARRDAEEREKALRRRVDVRITSAMGRRARRLLKRSAE